MNCNCRYQSLLQRTNRLEEVVTALQGWNEHFTQTTDQGINKVEHLEKELGSTKYPPSRGNATSRLIIYPLPDF